MRDRRQHPRKPVEVVVAFKTREELLAGITKDASIEGIFIEIDYPPPVGSEVVILFRLPSRDDEIMVRGKVMRVVDEVQAARTEGAQGMGIKFMTFDDGREELMQYLETITEEV